MSRQALLCWGGHPNQAVLRMGSLLLTAWGHREHLTVLGAPQHAATPNIPQDGRPRNSVKGGVSQVCCVPTVVPLWSLRGVTVLPDLSEVGGQPHGHERSTCCDVPEAGREGAWAARPPPFQEGAPEVKSRVKRLLLEVSSCEPRSPDPLVALAEPGGSWQVHVGVEVRPGPGGWRLQCCWGAAGLSQ